MLLVDLDPQGNATMGSGVDKRGLEDAVYERAASANADLAQAVHVLRAGGYDLLPANRELAGAEVELVELRPNARAAEAQALAPIACEVRLRPDRLPAVAVDADAERAGAPPTR